MEFSQPANPGTNVSEKLSTSIGEANHALYAEPLCIEAVSLHEVFDDLYEIRYIRHPFLDILGGNNTYRLQSISRQCRAYSRVAELCTDEREHGNKKQR